MDIRVPLKTTKNLRSPYKFLLVPFACRLHCLLEELDFLATGTCHMDFAVMCQEDFDTTFGSQNHCVCDPFALQTISLLALTAPLCLERLKNQVLSRIRSFSLFFCGGLVGALVAPRSFLLCCGCVIPCLLLLNLCCLGLSFRGPLEAVFLSLRRSRFRI